jgi:hypothetical protein
LNYSCADSLDYTTTFSNMGNSTSNIHATTRRFNATRNQDRTVLCEHTPPNRTPPHNTSAHKAKTRVHCSQRRNENSRQREAKHQDGTIPSRQEQAQSGQSNKRNKQKAIVGLLQKRKCALYYDGHQRREFQNKHTAHYTPVQHAQNQTPTHYTEQPTTKPHRTSPQVRDAQRRKPAKTIYQQEPPK